MRAFPVAVEKKAFLLVQWDFNVSYSCNRIKWLVDIIISVCVCAHDVCLGVQTHGVSAHVRTTLWSLCIWLLGTELRSSGFGQQICWCAGPCFSVIDFKPPLHCFSEPQTHSCLKVFACVLQWKLFIIFYCNYFLGLGVLVVLIDTNSVFWKYIIKNYFSLRPWGKLS